MTLAKIVLDTNKTTPLYPYKIKIRQGDSGEVLPVKLGNGFLASGDLSNVDIAFFGRTSNDKVINADVTDKGDGEFSFTFPESMYQAPGAFKVAYFKIGNDSTANINLEVISGLGTVIETDYIGSLEGLILKAQDKIRELATIVDTGNEVIDNKVAELIGKMTDFVDKSKEDLDAAKAAWDTFQSSSEAAFTDAQDKRASDFNSQKAGFETDFNKQKADFENRFKALLATLQGDYDGLKNLINKDVADFNTSLDSLDSQATDVKNKYDALKAQLDLATQNISGVRTNLLLKTYKSFSMTGDNTVNQARTIYKLSRRLEKGTTVTLSFDAVSTAPASFIVLNLGGTWQSYLTDTVDTKKKHYVATITLDGSSNYGLNIRLDNVPSTVTVTFSNMKLEIGPTATDYSLNPLDIATSGSVQTAIENAKTLSGVAEANAKKYADEIGVSVKKYADSTSATAKTEANKYTDSAINNLTNGDAGELLTEKKGDKLYAKVDANGDLLIDDKALKANESGELEYNAKKLLMAVAPTAPTIELDKAVMPNQISYRITPPKNLGGSELRYYTINYKLTNSTEWTAKNVPDLIGLIDNLAEFGTCQFKVSATTYAGTSEYSEIKEARLVDNRIFGASWDRKSDPTLTRTDTSIGWSAGINGDKNDFDNVDLYKGIHDVEDEFGNAFVRIPKCYIKKTQIGEVDDGLATWQISLVNHGDGWYLPKCFWDFDNEKELDYVDVGKYDASNVSSKLVSKTGLSPMNYNTFTTFRTYAQNNGRGYQLLDIHTVDLIKVLFTVEFATLDSQSIMKGHTDAQSAALKSGDSDGHLGSSGNNSTFGAMNYRGIENLWGNLFQAVDGANFNGADTWICDDSNKYQSNLLASPYKKIGCSNITTAREFTKSMGFDSSNPSAQFPAAYGGSAQTYYSDYSDYSRLGLNVAYFGGTYNQTAGYDGLWSWSLSHPDTDSNSNYGCRLLKKALS